MPLTIQIAAACHCDTVEEITRQTIAAVYPRYYPAGAVAFFQAHHSRERIRQDVEAGRVFLAIEGDVPVGTVTIHGNEMGRLFVLPQYQGRGAGRLLMHFAEERIFQTYAEVQLDASLPAKRIYRKLGYQEISYHIIETENGDYLCYDRMRKQKP